MKRGRKAGQRVPGSLASRLIAAKPGERIWTEQDQRNADTAARRLGVKATTRRFYALHPDTLQVIPLVCIDVEATL
jgi:hypothetical protein